MTQQPPKKSPKPKAGFLHFAINTQNPVAWYNRGGSFYQLGKYQEAIECFDRAIAIQPAYFDAWNNRGVAFKALSQYQEAIECFDQAISLQPNYYQAWNNRGNVFLELEQYSEAISNYDQAILLQPDDEIAKKNRAEAWEKLTQNAQTSTVQQTTQLEPTKSAFFWQEECRQGWQLFHQHQEIAALQHWQQTLQNLPSDLPEYRQACGELYYAKGWVEFQQKQLKTAKESLLAGLEFIPAFQNFQRHLEILQALMNVSDALGEKQAFQRLQPLLTPYRDAIYWQVKTSEICPTILRYQQPARTLPTGFSRQFWRWFYRQLGVNYPESTQQLFPWIQRWNEIHSEALNDSEIQLKMLAELSQILRVNECLGKLGTGYELIVIGSWHKEEVPVDQLFPQRLRIYTGAQRTGMPVPA